MPEQGKIDQEIVLHEAIDGKAPGHYARVFRCKLNDPFNTVAIKIMRSEHYRNIPADLSNLWYVETFAMEASMLARMQQTSTPALTPLRGCGFIDSAKQPVAELYIPGQHNHEQAAQEIAKGLAGSTVTIYSPKEVDAFAAEVENAYKNRHLPFLLLELRDEPSLFEIALGSFNQRAGLRFPVAEAFELIYQACVLLEKAHSCNIVYKDFKLAHYYWDGLSLHMIDWNSSAFIDPNTSSALQAEARARDVYALICSLVPLFSGRPFMTNSFYADPSPPYRVQTRYQNPQPVQWDESDAHVGSRLQEWVNRGVRAEFAQVSDLLNSLREIEIDEWGTLDGTDNRAMARTFLQQAVSNLRKGQTALRQSPDKRQDEASYFYREGERNLIDAFDVVGAYEPGTAPYLECERLFNDVARMLGNKNLSAIIPDL